MTREGGWQLAMVVLKIASKLIVFLISFGFVCLGTEWVPLFVKMTAFLIVLAIATIIGISVDTLQKRNLFIS